MGWSPLPVHLLSWRWTEFKLFQHREREAPQANESVIIGAATSPVLSALDPLPGSTGKWSHRIIKHLKKDPAAITTVSHPTSDSQKTYDLSTNNHQPESGLDCEQVPANCEPTSAVGQAPGQASEPRSRTGALSLQETASQLWEKCPVGP